MSKSLLELLVDAYNEPDPNPFAFDVGQRVRILKNVVDDGQTPEHWAGAVVTVYARYATGLHKDHFYKVTDGKYTCEFREEELDVRYVRKIRVPHA